MVASVPLRSIGLFLDKTLSTKKLSDISLNGLQVDGSRSVKRVALAVDACKAVFDIAASRDCDMILVHHGLFWGQQIPITGIHYRRLKVLMDQGISLYAAHLPLDIHKTYGNNAQLAKMLKAKSLTPFGDWHGEFWGYRGTISSLPLEKVKKKLEQALETKATLHASGPKMIKTVGFVSGGGTFALEEAASLKLDLLVSGEPKHSRFHDAKELGLNVLYLGHYKTETLGVKAIGEALRKKFHVDTVFIDVPTGL